MMVVKGRIGPRTDIEKEGVNRILAESSCTAAMDGRPPFRTKRVLVASVRGQAGKCGIMKGDVVTHVNGEPFMGTANDLRASLIHAYEEQGNDGIVMLVVNAEECTAEALRLRSLVR
jgi:S1-C subfamily serine protease